MIDDDDLVAEYLATALEQQDRGEQPDLAAICRDRPDLLSAVAEAMGLRGNLPELHDGASSAVELRGHVLCDRYRLDEAIGQGAVGMVFRAHDLKLSRDVAIKLLHHGLFASPDVEARFQREAEVLAKHEHAHIVRIYDQGRTEDGAAFLVTELLRGQSLQNVLDASRAAMPDGPSAASFAATGWLRELLPDADLEPSYLRQVVTWVAQLAAGLRAAHEHGVFHRDIKPSNIWIRDDGSAVLLDFGIAAREGDAAMTLPHAIVGTPCYMAPEQAEGRPEPRPSIDVYGLTATLYHLLTLTPPHEGDLQTVLAAVRTSDPTPAGWRHKGLPRDLHAILDCGLEHDLARRYADVQALAADVHAFLEHRPVSVRPIGKGRRFVRSCRRRPARAAAAFLGAALVATLVVLVPLWATVELQAATREKADIKAHLPADVAVEGWADMRALVPLAERRVVLGELDRLLELDPGDLSVRVLRAAERLDGGDPAGATEDFDELARRADSDYLREVARRYQAVAARLGSGSKSAHGHNTIDLTGLPEPTRKTDYFIAGFHALRQWDFDRAEAMLGKCADFIPARDLRLLASLGKRRPDPEALLAEAGWLEGHYGRKTARTRHVMAVAMLMMRRYHAAIDYCKESLELRPDRHGPWNNLGLAYLRTNQLDKAKAACQRAVAIRPWFANSLGNLAQTLRELGDYEGAERTARRMTDTAYREHELGNLATSRAIIAAAKGEHATRIEFANAAKQHFETAAAVPADQTRHPRRRAIPAAIAYATALAHPDPRIATFAFLDRIQRDADNPQHLANVAWMLRDQPVDDLLRDELRLLLLRIAAKLAPGKATILQARDRLQAEQRRRRQ